MKRIFKLLMVIALLACISPITAKADTKELFHADYDITVKDNMEGSGFVAGNTVKIKNEVDGILFTAGNTVDVTTKSNYIFAAGSTLNVDDSSAKDAFIAGSIIEIVNANIERDLYVAGQNILVTGNVGRNLFVTGQDVVIDGVINGDLYIDATSVSLNSHTEINGKLVYNDDAEIIISKEAKINSKTSYKNKSGIKVDEEAPLWETILFKAIDVLISFANIYIVGLLMILFMPNLFKKLREIRANRLLPSFAWGLVILLGTPFVVLLIVMSYVGIATGLIAFVLYGILIYVSTIFSAFTITSLIFKDKIKNPYLVLLVGLGCLYLIKLIPLLGGLVAFTFICIGLGLLTNLIKRK